MVEGRLRPPHPPDVVQYLAGRSREDIVEGGYGSSPHPASRRGECRTFGQQVAYSVLGTALPAERVRGEVQAMESGPRQRAVACPQLGQGNLFPAREVRVVRRGLWVRVAVCAGSLHFSGALSDCGSDAGQVDRRLCLGAFGCRAVGQLVGRFISSDVCVACDQRWKTDRFLVPFRPGALFSVASYLRPGLNP